ncbi:putative deoxyribonuclease TATDN1 [Dendronephthya gigantea]|uniref:putative deoxyribonuclease TATDN1 n=1 Tax=Dendronephthya gigantea TaxID=151771 RepID=UPI00106D097B|nr:putative deoxyribonuclease TATDN1 [Dendronephthya gigantea]
MAASHSEKFLAAGLKMIDIGANLNDLMFRGIYHGKQHHPDDLASVLKRAVDIGVNKMIVTCGCLDDIKKGLEISKTRDDLYCTVGCHPTRCDEFEKEGDPDVYFNRLLEIIQNHNKKVVAVGECGLDYDRLHFCSKETQLKYFEKQIDLAEETKLPMFLHMRNAHTDFSDIIKRNRDRISSGVAHCFTGNKEEAHSIIDQGLYIGLTGCSFKTEENVEVAKSIPVENLMIETDAPWCEIRPTHAGFKYIKTRFDTKKKEKWQEGFCVKSRNEPANLIQVLEVLAAIKEQEVSELAEIVYQNTTNVFFK